MLDDMKAGRVVIKGGRLAFCSPFFYLFVCFTNASSRDDEAHLVTANKTYQLRLAESSNTMLLLPVSGVWGFFVCEIGALTFWMQGGFV